MSDTLAAILERIARRAVHVSDHAYEEMRKDDILPSEALAGMERAAVVEDYPDANRGPSVLVLLHDGNGKPVHAVWGIPRRRREIAVLITSYRPEASLWTKDFLKRIDQ